MYNYTKKYGIVVMIQFKTGMGSTEDKQVHYTVDEEIVGGKFFGGQRRVDDRL